MTRVGIIGPGQHWRTGRVTRVSNQIDAFASSTHLRDYDPKDLNVCDTLYHFQCPRGFGGDLKTQYIMEKRDIPTEV